MKQLLILSMIICVFACTERNQYVSYERGQVKALQLVPEENSTSIALIPDAKGNIQAHPIFHHSDAEYLVVFQCEHKVVFTVNRKELWSRLAVNDSVMISYYEIYKKGTKDIVDFDFVDAKKIELDTLRIKSPY